MIASCAEASGFKPGQIQVSQLVVICTALVMHTCTLCLVELTSIQLVKCSGLKKKEISTSGHQSGTDLYLGFLKKSNKLTEPQE